MREFECFQTYCCCVFENISFVMLNPTAKSFNVLLYEYELQRHNLISPQGQSRHMHVEVRPVPDSGTLPLIALSVLSLSIGDIRVQQVCPAKGGESRRVRKKNLISRHDPGSR